MLKLLAVYSPEFPCLLKGAARYAPILSKTFEGNEVKQYIEFGTNQYRDYDAARPARATARSATARGAPACPNPPVPIGPVNLDEGSDIAPNSNVPGSQDGRAGVGGRPDAAPCPAGTPARAAEQAIVNALLAGRQRPGGRLLRRPRLAPLRPRRPRG